jgi:endonuclease-3 related protein
VIGSLPDGASPSHPEPATGSPAGPEEVFRLLLGAYGPQGWWPGASDPFEVVVGAVLTQSVAWRNVERALDNLRAAGLLSPRALLDLDEAALAAVIRPAGYHTVKARRLRAVARLVVDDFGGDLDALLTLPLPALRQTLLDTYGIGEETADDIIVYAARRPSFVVDAYTRRLFGRLGQRPPGDTYADWQAYLERPLPPDAALFGELHALIVQHGKERCTKRAPRCPGCPLLAGCPTGEEVSRLTSPET